MAFICAFTLLSVLLNINYGIHLLEHGQPEVARGFFINAPIALLILIVILWFCYIISKPRTSPEK
jgi:hypothetical protein